ncbi:Arf-domain-containing protein [Parathielavia appendiculata]|uniref:Arf-domain-containing protein n=1 Tax=Parathielavia appendiculata TaxID=2587402 RepID=A0AAN6TXP1_9PEZI|nr:Arf-domain-containing protein [Parathielavia appendiculata]
MGISGFTLTTGSSSGSRTPGNQGCSKLIANNAPGSAFVTSESLPDSETLTVGKVSFTTLDVGNQHGNRALWMKTVCGTSAIIFMVDARDTERFDEAAAELHALDAARGLERVPFPVLGNKIDCPGAETASQDRRLWGSLE